MAFRINTAAYFDRNIPPKCISKQITWVHPFQQSVLINFLRLGCPSNSPLAESDSQNIRCIIVMIVTRAVWGARCCAHGCCVAIIIKWGLCIGCFSTHTTKQKTSYSLSVNPKSLCSYPYSSLYANVSRPLMWHQISFAYKCSFKNCSQYSFDVSVKTVGTWKIQMTYWAGESSWLFLYVA